MTRRRVPTEEFITAWQTCESVSAVAEKLHGEKTEGGDSLRMSLSTRASQLRKKGIPLKPMPISGRRTGFTPERINTLTELARSLMKQ